MKAISLRRTKDEPKTIKTFYVKLSEEEKEAYSKMEVVQTAGQGYRAADSPMRDYTTLLTAIIQLRQVCTDLALCPSNINSLFPSITIKVVKFYNSALHTIL